MKLFVGKFLQVSQHSSGRTTPSAVAGANAGLLFFTEDTGYKDNFSEIFSQLLGDLVLTLRAPGMVIIVLTWDFPHWN